MAFSASDTAFEGFRLIRREPRAFLIWGAVAAAFGLATMGLMSATGATQMLTQMSNPQAAGANPMAYMGGFFVFALVAFALMILLYAVVVCGVYRAVLRPEDRGFAYLRLGADEGRMALLMVLMGLLWIVAWIVIVIVVTLLSVVVGLGAGAGQAGGAPSGGVIMLMLLLYLFALVFGFWFAVQFSMAAPMTFADRRITVFRSMKVVKGHFWSLLGCFALLAVITVLLYIVVGSLQMALNLAVGGPNPYAAMMHPGEAPDFSKMFSPAAIGVSVLVQFISVLFYPIWFAPQASAYQQLSGHGAPTKAADVFG